MIILHKKVPYYLFEILRYLCNPKCLKKYQRLQFYGLYVPILDETPYIVMKCTVKSEHQNDYFIFFNHWENHAFIPNMQYCRIIDNFSRDDEIF